MKKIFAKLCLFTLLFNYCLLLIPLDVKATTSSEEGYTTRNVCDTKPYELAYANEDGSLTNRGCYSIYQEAKTDMDQATDVNSDNLVILERVASVTRIIDARYAIVDLNKGNKSQNTNILNSGDSSNGTVYTYINGNADYGAVDAAYLGINIENKRIKIKISGITGWLREQENNYRNYKIVPLAWVKSTNKYIVTSSSITHYMTSNIAQTTSSNSITLGPKPTMLAEGTYYSYDGIYFYTDRKAMLADYKVGSTERAVNNGNPYYNYYLYLPQHSKTNYSGSDIDNYLKKIYDDTLKYNYTMLYGTGYAFYNAQELYGINAISMLSVAQNESANGKSKYATFRNNLFGHGAVDSNPDNATLYTSVRAGIISHATSYLGYGYTFPSNYRFYGSHLGNKVMGANVKYASDPYWGEKAAANYYKLDLANGLSDYNYYQLAVKSKIGTIYPAYEPKTGEQYRISTKTSMISEPYYNYGRLGIPVIIVDEVLGDTVEGSNLWYKIISDTNIDSNHKFVENNGNAIYNWDTNYVYVPASYFTKINNTKMKGTDTITDYPEKYYTYETFMTGEVATPQVAKVKENNTKLYLNPSLDTVSSRSWNSGQYVVVFEKAYDENGTLRAYQVSSTYKKGFKEWITPESISFTQMTYGRVKIYNGIYANVRATPGGKLLNTSDSGLASGTYVVVLDQKIVNGVTWIQIDYDGQLGWVVQKDADQEIVLTLSTLQNNSPMINASDQVVVINGIFNPMVGVSASDTEDGNITAKLVVESNLVNISQAGIYQVVYSVTDSGGLTSKKTIQVTVKDLEEKTGLFAYHAMKTVANDTFEVSGFLGVAGMDNKGLGIKHYFILKNVDTNLEYSFSISQWQSGYPYEMSNLGDDKNYDYSGGWFKGNVNLSSVPEGDYIAYVEVNNGLYKSRMLCQNLVYGEMPRKATGSNNRGYLFQMNYYIKTRPLDISIRDEGLLATSNPPTTDKMYNLFETISLANNKLNIRGTSHNIGIDYSASKIVSRQIVLENITTFKRYGAEVGAITTGDYVVDLKVSDGVDKTKAWFDGGIDLSNLEVGTYAIYIKTTVDGFSDYGELKDLSYRTFTQSIEINGKRYTLRRVDNKRFRMELIVQ